MKISIIGQGNVAGHLVKALGEHHEVVHVNSRTLTGFSSDAEICLIAVSDDAICEVASRLPKFNGIMSHTSGSVPVSILRPYSQHPGVLYPLQTFSRQAKLDYSQIPVFIEATTTEDEDVLKAIAASFSSKVMQADSDRRRRLHIAAVFACNYVNRMWKIAADILAKDGIPFDYLFPLIEETAGKLHRLSPTEAQTGPAIRGDRNVVRQHQEWLHTHHPAFENIYTIIANNILDNK